MAAIPSGGSRGGGGGSSGTKVHSKKTTKPKSKSGKKPAPKIKPFQQPPFDPRIRILAQPFGTGTTPLQRGHMSWDPAVPWPAPYGNGSGASSQTWADAAKVFFLFNPSVVAASYQLSDATAQSALIYPATSVQPILRVPLQQQISFTIMFDRTYEMMSAAAATTSKVDPTGQTMQNLGVELDILALKQFTGMFATVYSGNDPLASPSGSTSSADTSSVNSAGSGPGVQQGVMQMTFSYVYFGVPQKGLQYYGYIDSWDVQYTHFTQSMTPMRAVVDISFTLLPPPSAKSQLDKNAATNAAGQLDNPTTGQPTFPQAAATIFNDLGLTGLAQSVGGKKKK